MNVKFIRHGLCLQTREARFGSDGPLDKSSKAHCRVLSPVPAMFSPTQIGRDSAAALGLQAVEEPRLQPADDGKWNGLTLDSVPMDELEEWRRNPVFIGHGGESVLQLIRRTGTWLESSPVGVDLVVVTHAEIIRAAVAAISGNLDDYWSGPHCRLRTFEPHTVFHSSD